PDPEANTVRDARAIANELKRYDESLFAKERWLVINKIDLLDADARDKTVKAFARSLKWKGPVFAIAAVNGEGCRALTFAIQDWLDAHPAAKSVAEVLAEVPIVVKPAPVRSRRVRRPASTDDAS
ncbi:MAG: GTPase ObgE, partial [Casimicrobiaceae bacterium]